MFSKKYCSKKRQRVKNGLTIILLMGWQKNELSVLECAIIEYEKFGKNSLIGGGVEG